DPRNARPGHSVDGHIAGISDHRAERQHQLVEFATAAAITTVLVVMRPHTREVRGCQHGKCGQYEYARQTSSAAQHGSYSSLDRAWKSCWSIMQNTRRTGTRFAH